jgi:hypothetical protein
MELMLGRTWEPISTDPHHIMREHVTIEYSSWQYDRTCPDVYHCKCIAFERTARYVCNCAKLNVRRAKQLSLPSPTACMKYISRVEFTGITYTEEEKHARLSTSGLCNKSIIRIGLLNRGTHPFEIA